MGRSDELALMFTKPTVAVHRRFEVCRAYFMEHLTASAIADRFGLHVGSVQVMVRDFAADPNLDQFFVSNRPGRKTSPKREAISQRVAALRREGQTLGEIRRRLQQDGYEISESYLARILREACAFREFLPLFSGNYCHIDVAGQRAFCSAFGGSFLRHARTVTEWGGETRRPPPT